MDRNGGNPFWILDFIPSGCCVLDAGTIIRYWNSTLAAWTGEAPDRVQGRLLGEVFPNLERAEVKARLQAVLSSGEPTHFGPPELPSFFPCTTPEGQPRVQQITLTRLDPAPGEEPRLLLTVQDLTDQHARGEAYRSARTAALEEARVRGESEERLRKVLENMPVMAFAMDERQRCVFWNKEAERITGYKAEDLLEKEDVFHILIPDPRYRESVLHTMDSIRGNYLDWEVQLTCKHGAIRTIALSSISRQVPIPGWPGGWGIGVDTTERKHKEAALRESEAKHRVIAELSTSGILLGTAGGRIRECNSAACSIFQYSKEELTQMAMADLVMDEFAGPMRLLGTPNLSFGDELLEVKGRRKGGATFPAELSAKTYLVGGSRNFVAYVRDLSDSKRAEEAMRNAQKQESLGVLAGGIAHDFNNLFGAILGNLDLAVDRLPAESPVQNYLEQIRSGVLRASDLSRKMLAFSGKGRFAVQQADLGKILQDMESFLSAAVPKKVNLRYHLPEGLPPVDADPAQIQQVVVSLVNNASDAIGEGEGVVELTLGTQDLDRPTLRARFPGQSLAPGTFVTLTVKDSGCGINAEHLPRIFDPFFTTKFAGRGLSLSVVQGILRAHHAGSTVQSTVGRGTVFTLYFPVSKSVPAPAPAPRPALRTPAAPRCVLLVDDEAILRDTTSELLRVLGYSVITAQDGAEAVDIYRQRSAEIGMVLMDLTMPRMDGRDAFRAILQLDPSAKVVLSSGYSEHEVTEQFADQGLAGFLPKPYRVKDLRAVLESVLG